MQLIEISNEMKKTSPVFIVGEARSGTSILYRTLQKHSSFKPREINLEEANILLFSNRSYLFKHDFPKKMIHYMLNDQAEYELFIKSIRNIQLIHRITSYAARLTDRLSWLWFINLNFIMLRAFFYYSQRARGCRRLVSKPNSIKYVRKLLLAFPKCKMLYIYRHPIDVYTSYVRRHQIDSNTRDWTNKSPIEFCRSYNKSIDLAFNYEKKLKGVLLLIRYEDFTTECEKQFERVCNFLDEPFEKEAVIERTPDPTKWEIDPHLFGKIIPKTKNWEEFISIDDAKCIEASLESTMKGLGYNSYTSSYQY
jgi:hypothetical protein